MTATTDSTGLAGAMAALAAGDREAWGRLYADLAPELGTVAARVTGDAHLAQDAVQETFLDLRRNAGRFRPPADPARGDAAVRAWTVGIATKAALYLARSQRHRRRRDIAADLPPAPEQPDPGEALARRDLLRQGLAQLPPKLAAVVALRHLAGLDYAEIATAEGCSEGNARVRCSRGLARLRAWCARGGAAAGLALLIGRLEAAVTAAPAVALPAAPPTSGAATIPTTTLHGGIPLMTILGISGASLTLATALTLTAVYGLPGADADGDEAADPPPAVEPDAPPVAEDGIGPLGARTTEAHAAVDAGDEDAGGDDPLISAHWEDQELGDILAFLQRMTGRSFAVDHDQRAMADIPRVTLRAEGMQLSAIIEYLEAMTGTTIRVVDPDADDTDALGRGAG